MKLFILMSLILVVIMVMRFFLDGRISRKLQYAVWLILPVCVLFYFAFSVPVVVRNQSNPVPKAQKINIMSDENSFREVHSIQTIEINEDVKLPELAAPITSQTSETPVKKSVVSETKVDSHQKLNHTRLSKTIWLTGMVAVALAIVVKNVIFAMKTLKNRVFYMVSRYKNLKIYRLRTTGIPFLFGRSIYIPETMGSEIAGFDSMICHEYCHFLLGDNFWILLKYALVSVMWFNPLVWIALTLVQKDDEMAVDEKVIEILGDGCKEEYGSSLIRIAVSNQRRRVYLGPSMSLVGKNKSFLKKRISTIANGTRRSIAATLAVIMVMTLLVSCSMFKTQNRNAKSVVSEDSTWFNCKVSELKFGDIDYAYRLSEHGFVKTDDGYVGLWVASGNDGIDYYVIEIDSDGSLVSSRLVRPEEFGISNYMFYEMINVSYRDGAPILVMSIVDPETYIRKTVVFNLDTDEEIDISYLLDTITEGSTVEFFGSINGYDYLVEQNYGAYVFSTIRLGKDGEYLKGFDLFSIVHDSANVGMPIVIDDKLNFVVNGNICVEIDLESLTTSTTTWPYLSGEVYVDADRKVYYAKENGIYCDDELVVPYNCSYANEFDLWQASFVDVEDGKFTMLSGDKVYVFDKADTNPNAGKEIIKVGILDYSDSFTAGAIADFNKASDKYFAEAVHYDYEYTSDDYEIFTDGSDYEEIQMLFGKKDGMINSLLADMDGGIGPDVIIGRDMFQQLNSDRYLADMSSIVENELSGVELFDNVIKAAEFNGKLYQMPLSFGLCGVVTERSNVTCGAGFTYDEYEEFLYGPCNGENPIYSSTQTVFLIECLKNNSSSFIAENGKVDFVNEEFYALAKFTKENVPEETKINTSFNVDTPVAMYNDHIISYTTDLGLVDMGIYGTPSTDGRGPAISVQKFIAVASAASSEEAAKEFVSFTLNNPGILERSDMNTISVEATRNTAQKVYDDYAEYYDELLNDYSESELASYNVFRCDENSIDTYMDTFKNASGIVLLDPNIIIIVNEEIRAYFVGDKSIEEVAKIIEDRAQTVIDERG